MKTRNVFLLAQSGNCPIVLSANPQSLLTMSESIYNLVPTPYVEPAKPPMYRSKYDPQAPLTSSTFGLHGTTATIGGGVNELKKVRDSSTDQLCTCLSLGTSRNMRGSPSLSQFLS